MTRYAKIKTGPARETPQSEPLPGTAQVLNAAGGYVYAVDDWVRLDRFLINGSEGGTHYVSEKTLTQENAAAVLRCLQADPVRALDRIVEISESGRAPKNEPALFALALAMTVPKAKTGVSTALPKVARTGTMLFQFVQSALAVRGGRSRWGRSLRRAVEAWYQQPVDKLAYQAVKYQHRAGFTHRDLLRLAHKSPALTPEHAKLFDWVTHREKGYLRIASGERIAFGDNVEGLKALPGMLKSAGMKPPRRQKYVFPTFMPKIVQGYESLLKATTTSEVCALIRKYRLPREAVEASPHMARLTEPAVLMALLEEMPLGAMIRNLGRLTARGVVATLSGGTKMVVDALSNTEALSKARIHPIAVLSAMRVYAQGHGEKTQQRGDALTWTPVAQVLDALNAAFYDCFQYVEPTRKNILLALDVSGSMTSSKVVGIPGLTCREASAVLAMATARREPTWGVVAFTAGGSRSRTSFHQQFQQWGGQGIQNNAIKPISLSPSMSLESICAATSALDFGATDCALPMLWAAEHQVPVDCFMILTDNESWAGPIHASRALQMYREKMGREAKLAVVAMSATGYSVADPNDAGMLDCVGMDAAVPAVLADFARS